MIVKSNEPKTHVVEWLDADGPHKVILPIGCNDVELGVPVGYPFELVEFRSITPALVARTLREHGIWTARDLRGNVGVARAAILKLGTEIFTALLQSVREVDK